MFTMHVDSTAANVVAFMRDQKRRDYVIVNALNDTAKAIQAAERAHLLASFHVRPERHEFVLRQVAIISPFASVAKQRFEVRIRVGQRERLLLPQYEAGGTHEPVKGSNVAIPITGTARPAIEQNILPEYLFPALALHKRGGTWQGTSETFVIRNVGVYQRTGTDIRLLYMFKPTTPIPARLNFVRIFEITATFVFPPMLQAEIVKSLDYAFRNTPPLLKLFSDESGN